MTKQDLRDAPADTRVMGIVHDALRRDLERTRTALSAEPYPGDAQRKAIATRVGWMMHFLHDHHSGEDCGLWPLVRSRNPALGPMLDAMEADHQRLAAGIERLTAAAEDYGLSSTDDGRRSLLDALDDLSRVLLPHLDREEADMMPAVAAAMTAAEWDRWDHDFNVKGKSPTCLADEGHWLLDGLSGEHRRLVVELVPPIPRFVLVHGFAGRYRRRAAACWGTPAAARTEAPPTVSGSGGRRVARSGRVEVVVGAPLDAVWRLVCDVTRTGEWSHECHSAGWLGGASAPRPGVRFWGANKTGRISWSRVNEITAVDEHRELAWRTLPSRLYPDSTQWRIRLRPAADGGTRVVQDFEVLRLPAVLDRLYATMIPAHRDRSGALAEDLQHIGAVAANQSAPTDRAQMPAGA
ncbi:MAG: hemerythrin domain-containing protein [Acidimicrobiales bacterium]